MAFKQEVTNQQDLVNAWKDDEEDKKQRNSTSLKYEQKEVKKKKNKLWNVHK